jgi:SAM-dependent methyltransferase
MTMKQTGTNRLNPSRSNSRYYHLRGIKSQVESVIRKFLSDRRNMTLVDMGCGAMPYRPLLDPYLAEYIGVDLPGNLLAQVFFQEDGQVPLPDACADIVISTQVLEHVGSPESYLKNCQRILRPDGLLILSTHGYWKYHPDPTDFWRWTGDGLQRVVENTGFEVIDKEGIMGLAASGMQLFQDGAMAHIPRPARSVFSFGMQILIGLADRLSSRSEKQKDASVFVVVARKR